MGCDCKKTYSIGMGCCQPVLAPADNFYTKYQTDMRIEEAISGITVSGITEEQAEEMIEEATSGKANSSDVYTKSEVNDLLADKQDKLTAGTGIRISNNVISNTAGPAINFAYADVTTEGSVNGGLDMVFTKNDGTSFSERLFIAGNGLAISGDKIISVTGGSQPVDAYTKAETDSLLNEKADASNVYTKTEVDNKVSVKPNVWCGNESEWSQISASTESGTIYLVY